MKKLMSIVDVLGTSYDIFECDKSEDTVLEESDGYCDNTIHRCVIGALEPDERNFEDLNVHRQRVIRHELIHAFLFESGLADNSWASNEEIVDWIARQFPKMLEAFKRAGALEEER